MHHGETKLTPQQQADTLVGTDEIIEGEPRHAFLIQLCLIGGLILAMIVMAIVNRLMH